MLRREPGELLRRELAAAGLAALAPLAWWFAARMGAVPDVLDNDAGARSVIAAQRVAAWLDGEGFWPGSVLGEGMAGFLPGTPVDGVRSVMAWAAWMAGYGGWRLTRAWRPEAGMGAAVLAGMAAQLGPWTVWPLWMGNPPALAGGPVLLALSVPLLAPVFALWSAPAAVLLTAVAIARRQRVAIVTLLALGLLWAPHPNGAFVGPPSPPSAPVYAGAAGAWFPLPPLEAARWSASSAWFGGRWVHPMSEAVSGSRSHTPPPGALPLAIEAAVVPAAARTISPTAWVVAKLPEGRVRAWVRGNGVEAVGAPLLLLVGLLLAARARREGGWAVLAAAAGCAIALVPEAQVQGVAGRDLAALQGFSGNTVFFPPPAAPWLAGRWSADQVDAVGGTGVLAPAKTVVALSALCDTSFDAGASELAWAARGGADVREAAAADGVGTVVVDFGALPGWGQARLVRALGEGEGSRSLRVYRF